MQDKDPPDTAVQNGKPPRSGPKRTLDCDVCIVGDDVAGLIAAGDLACRGQSVIVVATGPDAGLHLDGALAPGFGLPTADLVARVGEHDAQELLILSARAAERGLRLAQKAGASVGPRGRLTVARPHAAADLLREHEMREALAPDSTILVEGGDVEALLGTTVFPVALGVVPAERIAPKALRVAFEAAARAMGVRFVPGERALSADLNGLRKYITTDQVRVRAFHVMVSGATAFARMPGSAPAVARASWVGGVFRLPGLDVPYAGLVEEPGAAGLRFHFDGDQLTFAAVTATPVLTRVGAARVVRRHARELYPTVASALVDQPRGRLVPDTGGMPLVQEGERGVWYVLAGAGHEVTHGLMIAGLVVGAIAEKDDRIRLLQPFAGPAGPAWAGGIARFAGFWHARLTEKLHAEGLRAALQGPSPGEPAAGQDTQGEQALPPVRTSHTAGARRGMAAASSASRHAAHAALHAASGWASGLAARVAAEPPRRRRPPREMEEDGAG